LVFLGAALLVLGGTAAPGIVGAVVLAELFCLGTGLLVLGGTGVPGIGGGAVLAGIFAGGAGKGGRVLGVVPGKPNCGCPTFGANCC
jgi:hypothetical protein